MTCSIKTLFRNTKSNFFSFYHNRTALLFNADHKAYIFIVSDIPQTTIYFKDEECLIYDYRKAS